MGNGMVLEDHVGLKTLLWARRASQLALTGPLKLFGFSLSHFFKALPASIHTTQCQSCVFKALL